MVALHPKWFKRGPGEASSCWALLVTTDCKIWALERLSVLQETVGLEELGEMMEPGGRGEPRPGRK